MEQKVKFIIREHHISPYSNYFNLFVKVFGVALPSKMGDVEIVTSLENFAKFLIERDKAGLSNSFKELSVEYFNEPKKPARVYV